MLNTILAYKRIDSDSQYSPIEVLSGCIAIPYMNALFLKDLYSTKKIKNAGYIIVLLYLHLQGSF